MDQRDRSKLAPNSQTYVCKKLALQAAGFSGGCFIGHQPSPLLLLRLDVLFSSLQFCDIHDETHHTLDGVFAVFAATSLARSFTKNRLEASPIPASIYRPGQFHKHKWVGERQYPPISCS